MRLRDASETGDLRQSGSAADGGGAFSNSCLSRWSVRRMPARFSSGRIVVPLPVKMRPRTYAARLRRSTQNSVTSVPPPIGVESIAPPRHRLAERGDVEGELPRRVGDEHPTGGEPDEAAASVEAHESGRRRRPAGGRSRPRSTPDSTGRCAARPRPPGTPDRVTRRQRCALRCLASPRQRNPIRPQSALPRPWRIAQHATLNKGHELEDVQRPDRR